MSANVTTNPSEAGGYVGMTDLEYHALVERTVRYCEPNVSFRTRFRELDPDLVITSVGVFIKAFIATVVARPRFVRVCDARRVDTESFIVEVTACFVLSPTVSAEEAAEIYDELQLRLTTFMSASLEGARVGSVTYAPKDFVDALLRSHSPGTSPCLSSLLMVYEDYRDEPVCVNC
jgi:hypothetical protein